MFPEDGEDKVKKLLRFITGSDRLAFAVNDNRNPPFTIRRVENSGRLPSASTCTKELLLPDYETEAQLAEALEVIVLEPLSFGKP